MKVTICVLCSVTCCGNTAKLPCTCSCHRWFSVKVCWESPGDFCNVLMKLVSDLLKIEGVFTSKAVISLRDPVRVIMSVLFRIHLISIKT